MLCNFGFVRWLYTRNSLLKILREHELSIDQLNYENAILRAKIAKFRNERERMNRNENTSHVMFFHTWFKNNYVNCAINGKRIIATDISDNVMYDSEARSDLDIYHLRWKPVLSVIEHDAYFKLILGD